ncbi:MAG: cyclase family protein [Pseudomonadota bacterium]
MRIIDLSLPIVRSHLRWPIEQSVKGDLDAGDLFQATTLKVPCHGFTHVDAQRHFFAGAPTIDATPLAAVVGMADVIDLKDVQPNSAIDAARLAERADHIAPGAKIILATAWHQQRSFETAEFWRDAPYITRDGAEWLLSRGIETVAYDFPQDYVIRLLLDGDIRPRHEHVTHDVLLRNGIHMVEYISNTADIMASRVFLSAAPLKIPDADGAPARVYAIEEPMF